MIVLDASVALKWFVEDGPLTEEADVVLDAIEQTPSEYLVPDLFLNEILAVLCRLPGATASGVQEAIELIETLGLARGTQRTRASGTFRRARMRLETVGI